MSPTVTDVTNGRARHRAPNAGRGWGPRTLLAAMAAPITAACGATTSVVAALFEQPVLTAAGVATASAPLFVTGYLRHRRERRLAVRRARALTAELPPVVIPDVDEVAVDQVLELVETGEQELVAASVRPYLDGVVTPSVNLLDDDLLDVDLLIHEFAADEVLVEALTVEVLTVESLTVESLADDEVADDEVAVDEVAVDAAAVELDEPVLEPAPAGRHAGADRPVDARVDTGELQRIWDLGDGPDTGPLPVVPDVVVVDDGRLVTEAPAGKQAVLVPGLSGTGTTQVLAPVLRRTRAGTSDDRVLDALLRSEADDLTRLLTMAAGEGRHATTGTVDSSRALPAGPSAATSTRRRGRHAA